MLEHVPSWLGHLLSGVRAGADRLAIAHAELGSAGGRLDLSSPAFADRARMPVRFTADGEGVSPPLYWDEAPPGTRTLALIVEDADAPAPSPIVHAVAWIADPAQRNLAEGALSEGATNVGRNSFNRPGWLPPDPPTGHGEHRYAFQLFALDGDLDLGDSPGRTALIEAMRGHVLASGLLVGTYSRENEAAMPVASGSPLTA